MTNDQETTSSLARRLAGLARFADDVNRQARATRYQFQKESVPALKVLKQWLEHLGAGSRDTFYKALLEHIADREQKQARSRAAARRKRREQP